MWGGTAEKVKLWKKKVSTQRAGNPELAAFVTQCMVGHRCTHMNWWDLCKWRKRQKDAG